MNKHTFLTEEIRRIVQEIESRGWTIRFRWTKSHVGTTGNELAVKLAKEASNKREINISYNRIPKRAFKREREENSNVTWQKEWETKKWECNKRILSDSSGETRNENKLHTKPKDKSNRPREHTIISTRV